MWNINSLRVTYLSTSIAIALSSADIDRCTIGTCYMYQLLCDVQFDAIQEARNIQVN